MKRYDTEQIRNLAVIGHSGSGKTSLTEAALYLTGASKRLGKIEEGSTASDFDKEEIARGISISLSLLPVEARDCKINFIDTPGYFDFAGQVIVALHAAESALMVLNAAGGIEVGSEIYWDYCEKISLPRIIFVNKLDEPNVDFNKLVSTIHQQFGKKVIPLVLPMGEGDELKGLVDVVDKKAYEYEGFKRKEVPIPEDMLSTVDLVYDEIAEVVATADDELMMKYFDGQAFTDAEVRRGMAAAIMDGSAIPLLAGSASLGVGIDLLLETITKYLPAPNDPRAEAGFRPVEGEPMAVDADGPTAAYVFKTYMDPYVGKISLFKTISGVMRKTNDIYNVNKKDHDKPGDLYCLRGSKQLEVEEVPAGDIGAFTKLDTTESGDTLAMGEVTVFKKISLPEGNLSFAIRGDNRKDEDGISDALKKLQEEDHTFKVERNAETKQLLIRGLGNVQLEAYMNKLKNNYGVSTHKEELIIPYRETISGKSEVQGKYKKQTGGAGQYGDVWVRFEPIPEGFEFAEEVFGGAVPKNYFPAVEKGLRQSMDKGPLAGYKVTGVKATLYDGSYHPVDSNEGAFQSAARLAFKKGITEAKPKILEPYVRLEITVPADNLGDIMGDINKRRGRILGMEQNEEGYQVVKAEAPMAEVTDYAIDFRSMTQGRGNFSMEFKDYETAPKEIADKIIQERQTAGE